MEFKKIRKAGDENKEKRNKWKNKTMQLGNHQNIRRKMKTLNLYQSGFLDYCLPLYCYIHKVFLIELGSLHVLYLIHWGHLL